MLHAHSPTLARVAGALLPLLDDPLVTELRVVGTPVLATLPCYVTRVGHQRAAAVPIPVQTLETFLATVAHLAGQVWTEASPRLHAGFPQAGLRIQAGGPPVSPAPWMVCRKHPAAVLTLETLVDQGMLTTAMADRLRGTLAIRRRMLIAGEVGAGKTTLLNALVHLLRTSPQSFVVIEDDPEIRCQAHDTITMATSTTPVVTMADLCKDALRLTPDWLLVGEVRDKAAHDMLKLFQCGTAGLATIHAESPHGALLRLEQCCEEATGHPQRALIGQAINTVVYVQRTPQAWEVASLWDVFGYSPLKNHYDFHQRSIV